MANVLDPNRNSEITTNVEVIAKGLPGWGAALRDLRKLAALSQESLATELGLNKTVVSHWEHERHRPTTPVLRKALIGIRVDVRLLQRCFGGGIEALDSIDVHTDPRSASLKIAEMLLSMPDANADELEDMLHDKLDVAVIAAQATKALSGDTRSAAFFVERGDRRREERRRERAWAKNSAGCLPTSFAPVARDTDADDDYPDFTGRARKVEPEPTVNPKPSVESGYSESRYDRGIPGPARGEPFGNEEPIQRKQRGRLLGRIAFD